VIIKPEVTCNQYRIDELNNEIVDVCTSTIKGIEYEVVIDSQGKLIEMWETIDGKDYPYRGKPMGMWKNIYEGAISGYGKKPDYCEVPKLNGNRHENT
jgi:hypothetical protein